MDVDVDRKTVLQIVVSVVTVGLFIASLVAVTNAYGVPQTEEDMSLEGDLYGEFEEFDVENGAVTGTFVGTYDNEFEGQVEGDVDGTLEGDTLVAEFDGTVSGALDGTMTGEMDGTVEENGQTSFDGAFSGTATGETGTTLSPDGGLILLVLILAYILILPFLGYLIERHDFGEDEE